MVAKSKIKTSSPRDIYHLPFINRDRGTYWQVPHAHSWAAADRTGRLWAIRFLKLLKANDSMHDGSHGLLLAIVRDLVKVPPEKAEAGYGAGFMEQLEAELWWSAGCSDLDKMEQDLKESQRKPSVSHLKPVPRSQS